MEKSEHDEQSLSDTIISMAQDFDGIHNISLLQPLVQFGRLTLGGKDARSIFNKLSPATKLMFPKDDDALVPIIPTALVNGCEGVGTGWSTFIPKYNTTDILANLRRLIAGQSMVPMDPWYRGFKGTIERDESHEGGSTYTVTGVCEEVDETTLRITILPIISWTDDYADFLLAMETDDGPFIQDIKAYTDDASVGFELTLSEENMVMARQEGFMKVFKPTTTIATTNMHLFDQNGVLKKYATPEHILKEFSKVRLQHYEKRKKIMLENLELQRLKLQNELKFISGVASGEIAVDSRNKADLVQELRQRGFTPFPNKTKPVEATVSGAIDATKESSD